MTRPTVLVRGAPWWGSLLPWLTLALITLALFMRELEPIFKAVFPDLNVFVYRRQSFIQLIIDHIVLVAASSAISIAIGVSAGIFVTRPSGREFRPIVSSLSAIGQTFPPVAVLAIVVPLAGFGFTPTIVALTLYGLLPIVQNTIAGLETVRPSTLEAARGMGMSAADILWRVEIPLALPVIVAGVRVSVIINIGTATIGSTVGASSLGTPIIAGLVGDNIAYVIQGAVLVGLLAIVTDMSFDRLQQRLVRAPA